MVAMKTKKSMKKTVMKVKKGATYESESASGSTSPAKSPKKSSPASRNGGKHTPAKKGNIKQKSAINLANRWKDAAQSLQVN